MLNTVRKLTLSSLFEEYGIVAGQMSAEGNHLEPKKFIKALLMEEEYPINIVRAFLNNFYELDVTGTLLSDLYKVAKQIHITGLDGRTMSVYTDKEWTEEKDYFDYGSQTVNQREFSVG